MASANNSLLWKESLSLSLSLSLSERKIISPFEGIFNVKTFSESNSIYMYVYIYAWVCMLGLIWFSFIAYQPL